MDLLVLEDVGKDSFEPKVYKTGGNRFLASLRRSTVWLIHKSMSSCDKEAAVY